SVLPCPLGCRDGLRGVRLPGTAGGRAGAGTRVPAHHGSPHRGGRVVPHAPLIAPGGRRIGALLHRLVIAERRQVRRCLRPLLVGGDAHIFGTVVWMAARREPGHTLAGGIARLSRRCAPPSSGASCGVEGVLRTVAALRRVRRADAWLHACICGSPAPPPGPL